MMSNDLIKKIQHAIQHSQGQHEEICSDILELIANYVSHQPPLERQVIQSKINQLCNQNSAFSPFPHFSSNEHYALLDKDLKFMQVNPIYAQVTGHRQADDLVGLSYEDFKGDVVSQCDLFKGQDLQVLETQKPLEFLSYHHYGDGQWHLLWGEKSLLFDAHQNPAGVFSRARDMTNHPLIDMTRFLMKEAHYQYGRFQQKSFIYYIEKEHIEFGMTSKEKEILFYLVRGKTVVDARQI